MLLVLLLRTSVHGVMAHDVSSIAFGVAEAKVFDMEDGLFEQVGDVGVVKGVDDAAAAPFADHEAEVTQDTQLLRDGGAFHRYRLGKFADRAWALAEAAEDAHPARGRERLHRLRNLARGGGVEFAAMRLAFDSVRHR